MTTKELIRAEIERWKGYISVTHFAEDLLSFLDTLPDEPVSDCHDLKREYKEYVDNDPVFSKLVNRYAGRSIARHFAEWGAEHLAGVRKMIDKSLEKYASRAGFDYVDKIVQEESEHRWNDHDVEYAYRDGLIAGAEWQKRKMMEGVVEGEVQEVYRDEDGIHCSVSVGTDYKPGTIVYVITIPKEGEQ